MTADPSTTPLQAKAKMGQVFICMCCSKTFADRAAKIPMAVEMTNAIVGIAKLEPHPKYPDDLELAKLVYEDTADQHVDIAEQDAGDCCAAHTALCNANRIRFRKDLDGKIEIVGAEHLE